ncbi:MAG: Asp-tRNA(Asn)/Glu-tRNA(Gln) amidotransferase subunit GatC [Armatimonadota bacterium]|nr:Asp-tRNA(Asn)/Glu-tRNA(Gln) amidotransferase subunit GatC [Armatimonadota bacterium]
MAIDPAAVDHVARLARLALTDEERVRFAEQLARILEYCRLLDAQPIEGVPATSHVLPMTNVLRPDVVTPSLDREEVLAQAPAHEQGFFKVPRVFEAD